MPMKIVACKNLSIAAMFLTSYTLFAQEQKNFDFNRIEDNSYLLEEAYNQEPGVIQHISTFQYMILRYKSWEDQVETDKSWNYTFTEEWPVKGQKHQLSVTIPVLNDWGFGDVALNYRYQAVLKARIAFSPRFSIILPTGSYKRGAGYGVFGYQANLPLSLICSKKLVTHYNIGATYTPSVVVYNFDNPDNPDRPDITTFNYGASLIILTTETFNLMCEFAGSYNLIKHQYSGYVEKFGSFFINPGFRYAINFKSGLQVVPGIAVPIRVYSSEKEYGIFAYLSFEHPLKRQDK